MREIKRAHHYVHSLVALVRLLELLKVKQGNKPNPLDVSFYALQRYKNRSLGSE